MNATMVGKVRDIEEGAEINSAFSDEIEQELENQFDAGKDSSTIDYNDGIKYDEVDATTDDEVVEESDSNEYGGFRISNSNGVIRLSQSEYNELKADVEEKEAELEYAREQMNEARAAGDLSENEAFQHYHEVVNGLEADITKINTKLKKCVIVQSQNTGTIGLNSKVAITISEASSGKQVADVIATIVSEGFGGVSDGNEVKIPVNSDMYHFIVDRRDGEFNMIGKDGSNYRYQFKMIGG